MPLTPSISRLPHSPITTTVFARYALLSLIINPGDGPKSLFAVITPTGCNPLVGQRLYGNDSGMMLSDQGWQFFQRVG